MSSALPYLRTIRPNTLSWICSLLLTIVGQPSQYHHSQNGPNTDSTVYSISTRSLRCSFYQPEYNAVLKRYSQLKEADHLVALVAFKKERKKFVQESFEVRVTGPPVYVVRSLTSPQVWPSSGRLVERVFCGALCREEECPRA